MHLYIDTACTPMTIPRVSISNVQGFETMLKYPSTIKMLGETACRIGNDLHRVQPVTSNVTDVPSLASQTNDI